MMDTITILGTKRYSPNSTVMSKKTILPGFNQDGYISGFVPRVS